MAGNEIEIIVRTYLQENWSDWFDGLCLERKEDEVHGQITIMTGRVPDQSALIGLIEKIHNLGLSLIAINQIKG